MGYLFESEVYWGGGNFGGPVTEGGSHAKKVGDHCFRPIAYIHLCPLRVLICQEFGTVVYTNSHTTQLYTMQKTDNLW